MRKVYLASRFSRLDELVKYKEDLEHVGIKVTSRWLLGGHEWVGTADDEIPVNEQAKFAKDDLEDIDASDLIVCFTEESGSGPARGGRHTEFGYALAKGKTVLCVGHRENVFYCLRQVAFVSDWSEALVWLWALDRKNSIQMSYESETLAVTVV